jgi:hypothetical protein
MWQMKPEVIDKWHAVWDHLLDMAYKRERIVEELVVVPTSENEGAFYSRNTCPNFKELTFDYSWKHYKTDMKDPLEVAELKKLHVPLSLFLDVGVLTFMRDVFPNCEVSYWE